MAVFQELLVLASLIVGGQADCYYSSYNYYCTYYSYYYDGPGGIIGGVVGSLFGLGTLIALIVICICCRRRRANMGQVIGNRPVTSVTMVSQQTNQQATQGYATAQPGYPAAGQPAAYPVAGQPAAYPNSPMAPAGQYPPPTQQAYPMGSQPYPAQPQATPYNAGNMYDNNTAPMAGGGGFINAGFQPPPPYDQVATEKK